MAKVIRKKISDSNDVVSSGGRAERYWRSRFVKPSTKYELDQQTNIVDQYAIIDKYKLKGFEYGNWVNNNDRNDRLIATAESLRELGLIIGTTNVGCDGMIGIAFGARGHSKALAHFEPNTFMINLTKERGFGSLAHEYGHALDYFFGMYIDQHPDYTSLVGGRTTTQILEISNGGQLRKLANDLINAVTHNGKAQSDSYKQWRKMVGDVEYWFRRNEIFARVFEQWVRTQLTKKKITNTFLSKKKYEGGMYLTASDYKRVAPLMDKLIKEMASFMNNKKSVKITAKPKLKIASKRMSIK